jgi:hypothetical protein
MDGVGSKKLRPCLTSVGKGIRYTSTGGNTVMGMPSFDMTASCGNKFMNMGDFSKLLRKLSSESEANVSASSSLYILYEMKKK